MDLSVNTLIIILLGVIALAVVSGLVTSQVLDFQNFTLGQIGSVDLIPGG